MGVIGYEIGGEPFRPGRHVVSRGRRQIRAGCQRPEMERLVHYDWPGNIRELSNAVERATILGDGQFLEIPATDIGGATVREQAEAVASPSGASRDEIQRAHSMSVLRNTAGWSEDVRGAATFLGMHPNTFRSRMKKRAISPARL